VLNPFFLLSYSLFFFDILESALSIALRTPFPAFATTVPKEFTAITDITSLSLPYSNFTILPDSLGLLYFLFFLCSLSSSCCSPVQFHLPAWSNLISHTIPLVTPLSPSLFPWSKPAKPSRLSGKFHRCFPSPVPSSPNLFFFL